MNIKAMQRRLAKAALAAAEAFFLEAHGWTKIGKDDWSCPDYYDDRKKTRTYRGGHAMNAQKYYNAHTPFFEKEREYDGD